MGAWAETFGTMNEREFSPHHWSDIREALVRRANEKLRQDPNRAW
jgi:hypothetical protein